MTKTRAGAEFDPTISTSSNPPIPGISMSVTRISGASRRSSDQAWAPSATAATPSVNRIRASPSARSLALAQRCNFELALGTYYLPAFPVPDDETLDSWMRVQAREGYLYE